MDRWKCQNNFFLINRTGQTLGFLLLIISFLDEALSLNLPWVVFPKLHWIEFRMSLDSLKNRRFPLHKTKQRTYCGAPMGSVLYNYYYQLVSCFIPYFWKFSRTVIELSHLFIWFTAVMLKNASASSMAIIMRFWYPTMELIPTQIHHWTG